VSIILALAWRLNADDITRFETLLPFLATLYDGVSIASPPTDDEALIAPVQALTTLPIKLRISARGNENRRYYTLQQALTFDDVSHVHYCDGDHALARMERDPDDWKAIVDALQHTDCLVIGRSEAVFESYPRPLVGTERIINRVASHLVGQAVDLGAGSRGFSRKAVEFLMQYASPETHGIATDSEWVVLLYRGGYALTTYVSDSAIYEVVSEAQRQLLESAEQWAKRVNIAQMIIKAGLDASVRGDLPEQ